VRHGSQLPNRTVARRHFSGNVYNVENAQTANFSHAEKGAQWKNDAKERTDARRSDVRAIGVRHPESLRTGVRVRDDKASAALANDPEVY
jgi:hypothetical protein